MESCHCKDAGKSLQYHQKRHYATKSLLLTIFVSSSEHYSVKQLQIQKKLSGGVQ